MVTGAQDNKHRVICLLLRACACWEIFKLNEISVVEKCFAVYKVLFIFVFSFDSCLSSTRRPYYFPLFTDGETKIQLTWDHTISKQQWWVVSPGLRSFPRYAGLYVCGQEVPIMDPEWTELLGNAAGWCRPFQPMIWSNFQETILGSMSLCSSGNWHLEALMKFGSSVSLKGHMLEAWSPVWYYWEVMAPLRGETWREVFKSLGAHPWRE